jgi:hypothetical protein
MHVHGEKTGWEWTRRSVNFVEVGQGRASQPTVDNVRSAKWAPGIYRPTMKPDQGRDK